MVVRDGPIQNSPSLPTIEGWLSALIFTVAPCDDDTAGMDATVSAFVHALGWTEVRLT